MVVVVVCRVVAGNNVNATPASSGDQRADSSGVPSQPQAGGSGSDNSDNTDVAGETLIGGGVAGVGAAAAAAAASAEAVEAAASAVNAVGGATDNLEWSEVGTECNKRVFVCTNR